MIMMMAVFFLMIMMMTVFFLMVMMVVMFLPVLMVMMPTAAHTVLVIVMMMLMLFGMFQQFFHHIIQIVHPFDGLQDRLAFQFLPGSGDNSGLFVVLTNQFHCRLQFLLGDIAGSAQNNCPRMFNLIDKKFPEILNIHFALGGIHHCHGAVDLHLQIGGHILHRSHHIGELSHAGGLNQHSIRLVGGQHLFQGRAKVPHQGAADTAGIHLLDLNSCVLQKAAVNADLTELVFYQHNLGVLQGLLYQLLNQRSLACPQKAGYNINLCHDSYFLS